MTEFFSREREREKGSRAEDRFCVLPVCHNREADEEKHNNVKLTPPEYLNLFHLIISIISQCQNIVLEANNKLDDDIHVAKASRPASKVSALNKKASPLGLDDRLQAEDDQAEQVDKEGDLHQGGIALESLGWGW